MHEVEAHLVGCLTCRELVMALDDEAVACRAALRVEEVAPVAIREAPAARGLTRGVAPAVALAFELLLHEEEVVVPSGEVVEQTWVTSARTVVIEGTLRGDLIVFGDRVTISGTVDGDLLSVARKVEISGRVTGSTVSFGERVRISGEVGRNAYAAAEQTTLTESGTVGRDFVGAGEGVLISGAVGRDVMTFSSWLEVRGRIERDLEVRADRLEVMNDAEIGGDLLAIYLDDEEDFEIDSSAIIRGQKTIEQVDIESHHYMDRYSSRHFYVFFAISFAAAFLSGMAMFRIAPWMFDSKISTGTEFFRVLAYGFVAIIALPIGFVVLALTVIGIPIAVVGLFLFGTFAYFSKIVIGGIIGISIFGEPEESDWRGFGLPLVAGLGIVLVATDILYLGEVVGFVTLLTGLGIIADRLLVQFRL